MKLTAHRGASVEEQENTLGSLTLASKLGAYAVECDVRLTADGKFVLFHDSDLMRLGGDGRRVAALTERGMRELLASRGRKLDTLADVFDGYREDALVLLDIGNRDETGLLWECGREFFAMLAAAQPEFIIGIHSADEAARAREFFAPERILAFMDGENDCADYYKAGAGIIRLWEHWLGRVTPSDVKSACPGAEVWIMANDPEHGNNGSPEEIERARALGADGILLNDIRPAVEYERSHAD